ncbi:helix-turn-helix domain-containing protein [Aulosira sp. FACHB-615]|uniref:helix-turn-helix domain-containing protein n=1 Tax=Aulosira sp. FACHB-615 TaxID=2692777 RepID=UPI001687D15B|nr:helix-turn-helix transcriptional regulator [Aulosira sp. FACHB-615]MBD2492601.1 helix-turn-helix transcriptional regulator [Aulosira sp. FACHB-615]
MPSEQYSINGASNNSYVMLGLFIVQYIGNVKPLIWTKAGLARLGEIIRHSREARGLNLRDTACLISARTGVDIAHNTLGMIERGVGEPKYNSLAAIALWLGGAIGARKPVSNKPNQCKAENVGLGGRQKVRSLPNLTATKISPYLDFKVILWPVRDSGNSANLSYFNKVLTFRQITTHPTAFEVQGLDNLS